MYEETNYMTRGQLPIGKNEDVEFSEAIADGDDLEAQQRAAEADSRAEQYTDRDV